MPQSFNQFIREESGPYIDKDSKSKDPHAYHVDQHAHHTKQQKDKKHQGFKQLRRGVIYKSNSGSWVGVKMVKIKENILMMQSMLQLGLMELIRQVVKKFKN